MTWPRKRLLAAAAALIEAVLLVSGAYAADSPHLTIDPLNGPPGTTVTAQGTAFCVSCGPVEIDFEVRPVKQGITVASNGSFQTTFVVPGGALAGTDAVNAYQQGKLVTQTSFTVTPSAPAPTTTPTPQHTGSPTPSPTRGGPSAEPQPTPSPTGPSPAASNAATSPSSGATSATGAAAAPIAIVLAVLGLLVLGMGVVFVYRRLKANQ